MHEPLKIGIRTNNTLSFFDTFFEFNTSGYDVKAILEKLNFFSSLNNATYMRIFIPEDNITTHALQTSKNVPKYHPTILSFFEYFQQFKTKQDLK